MRSITKLTNWLKRQIRDQLGFTYAETIGILVCLPLITCLLATPSLVKWYNQKYNPPNYNADLHLLNSTLAWLQEQQAKNNTCPQTHVDLSTNASKKPPLDLSFDINTATQKKLQTIPAIGPVRSARIIKYRNQLGGFVREDQYTEIYGLGPVALKNLLQYTYIAPNFQPHKLSINQDDFKTLLRHPYLSYDQVKKVVQSREKHSKFNSVQEILHRKIIDQGTFEKVKAYLAT